MRTLDINKDKLEASVQETCNDISEILKIHHNKLGVHNAMDCLEWNISVFARLLTVYCDKHEDASAEFIFKCLVAGVTSNIDMKKELRKRKAEGDELHKAMRP